MLHVYITLCLKLALDHCIDPIYITCKNICTHACTHTALITIAPRFTISATQQAELDAIINMYGQNNVRALVENFNWNADTYPKLESAYREAEATSDCTLIELPVSKMHLPGILSTLVTDIQIHAFA